MRKIFTLLTMCMLASAAWAVDIVFDATVDLGNGTTQAAPYQIEKDGVTFAVSNGLINGHYRIYKSQTATFTSTVGDITQIVFECTAEGEAQYGPGCFTAATGSYTYEGKIGTWTGQGSPVVFTAATNQVRATKITVTVGEAGLAAPKINPAGGTYFEPIEVTITCPTQGAKIYYTTNGNDPTTSSTQYTAPFTLSADATVKAISALDGEVSAVVSASYVFSSERIGLGQLGGIADNTDLTFGYDATVLQQAGSTMYVKDDTGYGLIYGNVGQTYKQGDVIPKGYSGQKVTYNAEPEVKNPAGFGAPTSNVTVTAEELTAAQVGHNYWAHYVVFKQAVINMTDDNNGTLTDASGSCPIFNKTFGAQLPTDGKPYDVYAIVASYQQGGQGDVTYQILPVKVDGFVPEPPNGIGLGEMSTVADNTNVDFKYDATVIWQGGNNNNYLYVKDETGYGLIYGNVGQTYKFGDVIPKGFGGKKTTYKGEPELTTPTNFLPSSGTATLTPDIITTANVNHDYWAHYVLLKNVTISSDAKTLTDASGSCDLYNATFNIELPTNLNEPHDVYGIVGVFNSYQILPISFDQAPTPPGPVLPTDVASIDELFMLPNGTEGHFITPLTTIYQNGVNLYVKDVEGTYSLAYGQVAGEFVNGDYIDDAIATWSEYQGFKQLVPVRDTFVKAGHGPAVEPEMIPIEEISQDMVHTFFGFEDAEIVARDGNYYLVDETGELMLFDKFSVGLADLDLSKRYDVKGFLTVYKGTMELYPSMINEHGAPGFLPEDVNQDGEVNIADVNCVIDAILTGNTQYNCDANRDGEVNIADVNRVIDYILTN